MAALPTDAEINERLQKTQTLINSFGKNGSEGYDRTILSESSHAATKALVALAESYNLHPAYGPLGNVMIFTEKEYAQAFEEKKIGEALDDLVIVGSHIDTVPNGGAYDGALGVVVGLEAIRNIKEQGITTTHPVAAAILRGEESSVYGKAYVGSTILTKGINEAILNLKAEGRAGTFKDHLVEMGVDIDKLATPTLPVECVKYFMEAHIEQGSRLATQGLDVAVVDLVRGNNRFKIELTGKGGHSGTQHMKDRNTPMISIPHLITYLNNLGLEYADKATTTTSNIIIPGAGYNKVPGALTIQSEIRADTPELLEHMTSMYLNEVLQGAYMGASPETSWITTSQDTEIKAKIVSTSPIKHMNPDIAKTLCESATNSGYRAGMMSSGAGHDAILFGDKAMLLFVPGDESHTPEEWAGNSSHLHAHNTFLHYLSNMK